MGRSAYDFEKFAPADLQRYLKSFEIPPPPRADPLEILLSFERPTPLLDASIHRDRDATVKDQPWRKLEIICRISIDGNQLEFFITKGLPKGFAPELIISQRGSGRYILPSQLSGKFYTHKPCDISQMDVWLQLVTRTALRIMHASFPDICAKGWDFYRGKNPEYERAYFHYALWISKVQPNNGSLVFAYQTPFCLNEMDMQEFAECGAFPSAANVPATGLQGKFRLWANLWDACAINKTRYFVLTSYSQWIFGIFAGDMRVAFLSPIFRYDSKAPTILELMVYWLAIAAGLPCAPKPPQVDTPFNDGEQMQVKYEPFPERKAVPKRETYWPGNFHEPGPSSGASEKLGAIPFSREGSVSSVYPEPEQVEMRNPDIREWLSTFENALHRRLDEDDFHGPPPGDELEDFFNPNVARGEWMVPL